MSAPCRNAADRSGRAPTSARAPEPAKPASTPRDWERSSSSGGSIPASGAESVSDSITLASAIPSAMQ